MRGAEILFLDEVDSTNNEIRRLGDAGAAEGTVVVAERQTGGKGRRGREWYSPAGAGIWMSVLLRPELEPDKVSGLTLMAALSVCRAIRRVTGLESQIKWPNDLVIDGRKVCGILTEAAMSGDELRYVVLGIGINVNQTEFPEELPYAYSLAMAAGHGFDRKRIIADIMDCLDEDYEKYLRTGDMSGLRPCYEEHLANRGMQVRVLASSGEWTGVAAGIADSGDLLVCDESGKLNYINSGEVSVRGIYGYT